MMFRACIFTGICRSAAGNERWSTWFSFSAHFPVDQRQVTTALSTKCSSCPFGPRTQGSQATWNEGYTSYLKANLTVCLVSTNESGTDVYSLHAECIAALALREQPGFLVTNTPSLTAYPKRESFRAGEEPCARVATAVQPQKSRNIYPCIYRFKFGVCQ
jgi:hypothetical protein